MTRSSLSIELGDIDGPEAEGQPVMLGIRPHDIELVPAGDADAAGRIEILEPLGATTLAHVRLDDLPDGLMRIVIAPDAQVSIDDEVGFRVRRQSLYLFAEATGARLNVVLTPR